MQHLEQYKVKHLSKFSQLILLDDEANIVSSCDSIFPTEQHKNKPVTEWFPFLESIFSSLLELKTDTPEIRFARVETPLDTLAGNYDFTFTRVELDGQELILWSIFDYTDLYEYFKEFQQRRNELEIHRQMLEQRYKQLKHQKDILIQKNLALENLNEIHNSYFGKIRKAIQSPINALDGLTFILSKLSKEQDEDYISNLKITVKQLQGIIDEFQAMPQELDNQDSRLFNPKTVTNKIVQQFNQASNYQKKLSIEFSPSLPLSLMGNIVYLRQIIYSLLLNSFKTNPSGETTLTLDALSPKEDKIAVQFSFLEKVANVNTQIDQSDKAGTDVFLRLSIVKKMVELMDGEIKVNKEAGSGHISILVNLLFELPK